MIDQHRTGPSNPFSEPDQAQEEARALRHDYIGTEHLLLALLRGDYTDVIRVLSALGITADALRAALLATLRPVEPPDRWRAALLTTLRPGEPRDRWRAASFATRPGDSPDRWRDREYPYTARMKSVLRLTDAEARSDGSSRLTGMHFLQALLLEKGNIARYVIHQMILDRLGLPSTKHDTSKGAVIAEFERAGLRFEP
jgi:ATP-dependent Clp protease ATP-binding subunit ClpA